MGAESQSAATRVLTPNIALPSSSSSSSSRLSSNAQIPTGPSSPTMQRIPTTKNVKWASNLIQGPTSNTSRSVEPVQGVLKQSINYTHMDKEDGVLSPSFNSVLGAPKSSIPSTTIQKVATRTPNARSIQKSLSTPATTKTSVISEPGLLNQWSRTLIRMCMPWLPTSRTNNDKAKAASAAFDQQKEKILMQIVKFGGMDHDLLSIHDLLKANSSKHDNPKRFFDKRARELEVDIVSLFKHEHRGAAGHEHTPVMRAHTPYWLTDPNWLVYLHTHKFNVSRRTRNVVFIITSDIIMFLGGRIWDEERKLHSKKASMPAKQPQCRGNTRSTLVPLTSSHVSKLGDYSLKYSVYSINEFIVYHQDEKQFRIRADIMLPNEQEEKKKNEEEEHEPEEEVECRSVGRRNSRDLSSDVEIYPVQVASESGHVVYYNPHTKYYDLMFVDAVRNDHPACMNPIHDRVMMEGISNGSHGSVGSGDSEGSDEVVVFQGKMDANPKAIRKSVYCDSQGRRVAELGQRCKAPVCVLNRDITDDLNSDECQHDTGSCNISDSISSLSSGGSSSSEQEVFPYGGMSRSISRSESEIPRHSQAFGFPESQAHPSPSACQSEISLDLREKFRQPHNRAITSRQTSRPGTGASVPPWSVYLYRSTGWCFCGSAIKR